MRIELKREGETVVASLEGEIDGRSAPEIQETLLPAIDTAPCIVLDMTGVTFMSSAGLRMLLLVQRRAASGHRKVVLVGLGEQLRDTMAITGFAGFFVFFATLPEALASVGA